MSGFTGEQFARPEALDLMRAARRSGDADIAADGVANADPLNLAGIILPGARVSPIAPPIPMVAPTAQSGSSINVFDGSAAVALTRPTTAREYLK